MHKSFLPLARNAQTLPQTRTATQHPSRTRGGGLPERCDRGWWCSAPLAFYVHGGGGRGVWRLVMWRCCVAIAFRVSVGVAVVTEVVVVDAVAGPTSERK